MKIKQCMKIVNSQKAWYGGFLCHDPPFHKNNTRMDHWDLSTKYSGPVDLPLLLSNHPAVINEQWNKFESWPYRTYATLLTLDYPTIAELLQNNKGVIIQVDRRKSAMQQQQKCRHYDIQITHRNLLHSYLSQHLVHLIFSDISKNITNVPWKTLLLPKIRSVIRKHI